MHILDILDLSPHLEQWKLSSSSWSCSSPVLVLFNRRSCFVQCSCGPNSGSGVTRMHEYASQKSREIAGSRGGFFKVPFFYDSLAVPEKSLINHFIAR